LSQSQNTASPLRARSLSPPYPPYINRALTTRDEHQTTALTQFRANLESANLAPATPEARQAKASEIGYDRYDDQTLLRFLRARKFDLPKAQIMWEANEKWRKDFGTDEIAA
jgi:hypothetical protein